MKKTIIVKWKIKAPETTRVLQLLPDLVAKARNEEGAIFYDIYQSEAAPNELFLHEQYADAAALEAHKQSEHYQRIVVKEIIPHLETREAALVTKLF